MIPGIYLSKIDRRFIFNRLINLHHSTLPSTVNKMRHTRYMLSLSKRLYVFFDYINKIKRGELESDFSIHKLMYAYILGINHLKERRKSKFRLLDEFLYADEEFYTGIWGIICEYMCGYRLGLLDPYDLNYIRETSISKKDIISEYDNFFTEWRVFCKLENLKMNYDEIRTDFGKHYHMGNGLFLARGMFAAFRYDYLKRSEPTTGYWLSVGMKFWKNYHYYYINQIETGIKMNKRFFVDEKNNVKLWQN